jgi:hypothetical protein
LFADATFEDWDGNTIRSGAADVEEMYATGLQLHGGTPTAR